MAEFVEMNWDFMMFITKKNKKEQRGGEKSESSALSRGNSDYYLSRALRF